MTKYLWALASSALVVLLGASLIVWPFLVHTNLHGWNHATTTEFWSGVGVAVVGLLMLAGWYGGLRAALMELGIIAPRTSNAPEPVQAAPASADEDLDRLLRPLAETVLRDLTEQLAAKDQAGGGRQA